MKLYHVNGELHYCVKVEIKKNKITKPKFKFEYHYIQILPISPYTWSATMMGYMPQFVWFDWYRNFKSKQLAYHI